MAERIGGWPMDLIGAPHAREDEAEEFDRLRKQLTDAQKTVDEIEARMQAKERQRRREAEQRRAQAEMEARRRPWWRPSDEGANRG